MNLLKKDFIAIFKQVFVKDGYSLIPIRYQDRYEIMKWRNEQIYHLRQHKPLTKNAQNSYFKSVISKLFSLKHPDQLLFSYLHKGKCIGYGGLVHINWIDKNAEISFIMDTILDKTEFDIHWTIFLELIEQVAFEELNFHKIFVFAFDVRPHLYLVLQKNGYLMDATLKQHCFVNGTFKDVLIYSKWKIN